MPTNYVIQILKSEHISGKASSGRDYSFYRHSCLVMDERGTVIEVGDLTTDNELQPGKYPAGFEVGSYQGKLTVRLVPQLPTGAVSQNKP